MNQTSLEPGKQGSGGAELSYKERLKQDLLDLTKDAATTNTPSKGGLSKAKKRKKRPPSDARTRTELLSENTRKMLTLPYATTNRPTANMPTRKGLLSAKTCQMLALPMGKKNVKLLKKMEQKKMEPEVSRTKYKGQTSATFDTDFVEERYPWFLYPFGVCWRCEAQLAGNVRHRCGKRTTVKDLVKWVSMVNGLLWNFCYRLRIPTLHHLMLFVQSQLAPLAQRGQRLKIPAPLRNAMKFFEKVNGIESQLGKQYCSLPPNCVAALIHQRIINFLLYDTSLKFEDPVRICNGHLRDFNGNFVSESMDIYFPGVNVTWPMAADAHVHLDLLLKQSGKRDYDSAIVRLPDAQAVFMDLIVASYANPNHWPSALARDHLEEDSRFKIAIGWNPRFSDIWNEVLEKSFREWLHMRDVVAVGEIGLDYYAEITAQQRERQFQHLCRLLPYVRESGLPLIIHCRQHENGQNWEHSVVDDCVNLMRQYLPPLYSIYVSAFNGGIQDFEKWCCNFPNVRFGISPVILSDYKKHPYLDKAVEMMEECRIMLETNVPLHTPEEYVQDSLVAQPDLLVAVADKVASIRLSHRALVMDAALQNTHTFYRC